MQKYKYKVKFVPAASSDGFRLLMFPLKASDLFFICSMTLIGNGKSSHGVGPGALLKYGMFRALSDESFTRL
jgi:hypothetical protein